MDKYKQETVWKCLKSKGQKPNYFEPWYLPNCFSLCYRYFLIIQAFVLFVYQEQRIGGSTTQMDILFEQPTLNILMTITYSAVGIQHYFIKNKMDSNLTNILSQIWSYCLLYCAVTPLGYIIIGDTAYMYEHGKFQWILLVAVYLPLFWEFTYIRWTNFYKLYIGPFVSMGIFIVWLTVYRANNYTFGRSLQIMWLNIILLNVQHWLVWSFLWYLSYISERRVSLIYDYAFKDDIFCKSLRTKDLKILVDQKVYTQEFESLKITTRHLESEEMPIVYRSDMF